MSFKTQLFIPRRNYLSLSCLQNLPLWKLKKISSRESLTLWCIFLCWSYSFENQNQVSGIKLEGYVSVFWKLSDNFSTSDNSVIESVTVSGVGKGKYLIMPLPTHTLHGAFKDLPSFHEITKGVEFHIDVSAIIISS